MLSLMAFKQKSLSLAFILFCVFYSSAHAVSLSDLRKGNINNPVLSAPAVMAIVSLDDQTISLFDEYGQKIKTRISSGQIGYETPVGIYSVLQKEAEHYSNLYDDASMPFMQRITWSGLSLHAGELPGYPASHGCVRLPIQFAEKIFGLTRLGMRVIVSRNEVAPTSLMHPALFQPSIQNLNSEDLSSLPPSLIEDGFFNETLMPDVQKWPLRHQQQQQLKQRALVLNLRARELEELLEIPKSKVDDLTHQRDEFLKELKQTQGLRKNTEKSLIKAELIFKRTKNAREMTQSSSARFAFLEKLDSLDAEIKKIRAEIEKVNEALQDAEGELNIANSKYQEALRFANEAKVQMLPISVLVSLKTQRVYVRQGLEQIMEGEVTIKNPEQPIGTHIYTALNYDESGHRVRWNAVTLSKSDPFLYEISYSDDGYAAKKNNHLNAEPNVEDAVFALERVQLPPEIQKRISEYVWPRSSLIITDEEPHKETGKSTEFIVLISGEPQGGIIKRPRLSPYNNYNSYWGALFSWGDEDDRRRAERERRRFEKEVRRLEKKRQRSLFD